MQPTRFYGVYQASADRYGRDLARLGQEILPHLAEAGTGLTITIEIHATRPDGFDPDTIRTVTENANTLHFDQHSFEQD